MVKQRRKVLIKEGANQRRNLNQEEAATQKTRDNIKGKNDLPETSTIIQSSQQKHIQNWEETVISQSYQKS